MHPLERNILATTTHNPVTLTTQVPLDLPFWQHTAVFDDTPCRFLLDSGLNTDRRGRFSCLGGDPAVLLTGRLDPAGGRQMKLTQITWRHPDGTVCTTPEIQHFTTDPFAALRQLLAAYPAAPADVPFNAGLVGYFGYETAHVLEDLPQTATDDHDLPTIAFMVIDDVLVHDHNHGQTTLHVTSRGPHAHAAAVQRTAMWRDRLRQFVRTPHPPAATPGAVRALFDRERYHAAVQSCREHILAGDVFEVCLTHRLEMDLPGAPWQLYKALRALNPAPFASFLHLPECDVVSASPERFLQLNTNRVVESRPIKGTRPRGATPTADKRLARDLAAAAKDRAENIMIVDLMRNDLGKVCTVGSVEVPELLQVESYATVHQLVSTVRGQLRPEYDAFDLVRACFPGGSMTGAPKIEAMKIIDSLEPVQRGIYSGALGFIGANGTMDLSMVIRTIVCQKGLARIGVGGAVVADSDPDAEYEETRDKARALIAALNSMTP